MIIDLELDSETNKVPSYKQLLTTSDSRLSIRSFRPDRIDEALSAYQL